MSEAILSVNGRKVFPYTPLFGDGFEVPEWWLGGEGDGSTEDERVTCIACGATYDLSELALG